MKPIKILALISLCVMLMTAGCGKKADIRQPLRQTSKAQKQIVPGNALAMVGDEIKDIFFLAPSNPGPGKCDLTGFIAGQNYTVLKTTDGGQNWRRVVARQENGPAFERILFENNRQGWVVGRDVLIHTADGGESWSECAKLTRPFYYFGPATATTSCYYQMQAPTCDAHIYTSATGGQSWQAIPGKLPRNDFEAVFFLDRLHGWLAGNYGRYAYTTNGGISWAGTGLNPNLHLVQIQFINEKRGWMRAQSGHEGGILSSSDGGATWENMKTGIQSFWAVRDLQFLDELNGFLLVIPEAGKSLVMATSDGGQNWRTVEIFAADLNAFCFINLHEGWLAGLNGLIFHCLVK
jgi:photosystem II stability/assembly factor-like uncharacterized protein